MGLALYSYFRSSCSYRVRIALHLKGLDFETRAVHLVRGGGEQHSDSYVVLNPMRHVPILEHQGQTIAESVAILEYLEVVFPATPLIPNEPYLAARMRQVVEVINSGIQPLQNLKVLQYVEREYGGNKSNWARHWIENGLESLERLLLQTSDGFCVADRVSLADCFLVPQIYNARRFQVELDQFPTISAIDQRCRQLEAFHRAHPSQQPDTPDELRHDPY